MYNHMEFFMNRHLKLRRPVAALSALVLILTLIASAVVPAGAANKRFITELSVAAGENAVETLEKDGFSVMMVGLNVTPDPAAQVYLAYKQNTGEAITNVIVSPDVGDTCTDAKGIVYQCVSHVDVDTGLKGSAGCLYATKDKRAGAPLVGLDIIRGDSSSGEVLYPITNDGAEIARTPKGAPADLESTENPGVVYLAQIRDGIVLPYISEIGVVTDTDKWNAVYTACERGFNYFVEGDIDDSKETYTIIAYERTADPKKAITNITAVSEKTVKTLEKAQVVDTPAKGTKQVTAASVNISGAQYIRVSSKPVSAKSAYYLYMTKDQKAGNPISMLYAEKAEQTENFLFGMWANAYFFSPGVTTAYTYSMNEDVYAALWNDQTVCTKVPVQLLNSFENENAIVAAREEATEQEVVTTAPTTLEVTEEETTNAEPTTLQAGEAPTDAAGEQTANEATTEVQTTDEQTTVEQTTTAQTTTQTATEPVTEKKADPEKPAFVKLVMFTARDGLPGKANSLTGMNGDPSAVSFSERTQRTDRVNKYQASAFSGKVGLALIGGGVVIVAAVAFVICRKHFGKKTQAKKSR